MIERGNTSRSADMIDQIDDPEMYELTSQCITFDGQHYCAAQQFQLAVRRAKDRQTISMFLGNGRNGLHWQHTVHGARQLADQLNALADRLAAEQAEAAQTMLTATLTKGKSDGI